MGCVGSRNDGAKAAKEVSNQIDKQLKEDAEAAGRKVKLVLLGARESGKSTIAKQMRIMHQDGFSETERKNFKPVIFAKTVQSMVAILKAMESLNISFGDPDRSEDGKMIRAAAAQMENVDLSTDIGDALERLWTDNGVEECYGRSREYQLNDSAGYYIHVLWRLRESNYVPTEEDILHTRAETNGIIETSFEYKSLNFTLIVDGNQRPNRKVWNHFIEEATAIIFCVDLSGYDEVLAEDEETNRMHESLKLFESVCNHPFFSKTPMILVFNKKDLFEEKIAWSPLKICFPEYQGADEYGPASEHIREQFENQNRHGDQKEIYTHFIRGTDLSIVRFIFDVVSDILMQKIIDRLFEAEQTSNERSSLFQRIRKRLYP